VDVRVQKNKFAHLVLPDDLGLDCLRREWSLDIHPQESNHLTFLDTFEWGLWFGGYVLSFCSQRYCLSVRQDGWSGPVVCEEQAQGRRRFWQDFETVAMRTVLQELLGLRALAPVAEGLFRQSHANLLNSDGKVVCRLLLRSVSAGKSGKAELLQFCQVLPLRGYDTDALRVVECLTGYGARICEDGPLDVLLRQTNTLPQRYTLRPVFGLEAATPAREAIGRIVHTMLALAVHNLPGILSDLDTEFLHDYRVCLRKMRSVLSLVKGVYPADETQRIRQLLGSLARQTNRLRDLDVYLLAREEYLGLLPPGLRPALNGMFADFSAERENEVRQATSKIRSRSIRLLLKEIETFFGEQTQHGLSAAAKLPVGPLVFACIYKRYRKICHIAADIHTETPDEGVHQLRIECKKLRYLMEFFSEIIPDEDGAALQKALRRLQGRLGEFNDASVQQKALLDYWEQKKPGAAVSLGLGGLVSILYQRQQQTRTLIGQSLEEFCNGTTTAVFKRSFKRPASVSAPDAP
jgi:CHAD domain-containing protein